MRRKVYALRARFKKDIVCEFLPPRRPSRKVVIICGGMPGYPGKPHLLEFFSKKGYWAFIPRYRGSWESGGSFLEKSPHQDVLDIIDQLPKGFRDLYGGKMYKIKSLEIYLIGGSFGGPTVILASVDKRVKKAVALSPVVDWKSESKAEPIDRMAKFIRTAFGHAYRFRDKDWRKLKTGTFYNPAHEARRLDGRKILIFHAKDDKIVYFNPVRKFAKVTKCAFVPMKTGGYLSLSRLSHPRFWKRISRFFRS